MTPHLLFDLSIPKLTQPDRIISGKSIAEYCERGDNRLTAGDILATSADEYSGKLAIADANFTNAEYCLGNYQTTVVAVHNEIDSDAQIDFDNRRTLIYQAMDELDRSDSDESLEIRESSSRILADTSGQDIDLYTGDRDRLALANLDRHIANYPDDPYGYCHRGMCYDRLEFYLLALADFNRAIELRPSAALFYHGRGRTYRQVGNFSAALADFDRAIEIQPLASVYVDRADIYRRAGDLAEALFDYDRAIELNPQLISAYLQRSMTHTELGKVDAALADYDRIIDLDPQHTQAYLQRSWLYFRRGKYPLAIADCKSLDRLDGGCFHANYLLGVIHALSGLNVCAIEDFTRAIELAPNYLAPRYYRGIVYHQLKNFDAANNDFIQARSLQDRQLEKSVDIDETALYAEGISLYHLGQLESARTILNLAILCTNRFDNPGFRSEIQLFIDREFPD